ncbi:MAG: hypothetical protein K0R08_363 [Solimicrobium sp.]|jgi:hypothetical protein|nr:hypothetical protein [Solimicrobium sp.]
MYLTVHLRGSRSMIILQAERHLYAALLLLSGGSKSENSRTMFLTPEPQ